MSCGRENASHLSLAADTRHYPVSRFLPSPRLAWVFLRVLHVSQLSRRLSGHEPPTLRYHHHPPQSSLWSPDMHRTHSLVRDFRQLDYLDCRYMPCPPLPTVHHEKTGRGHRHPRVIHSASLIIKSDMNRPYPSGHVDLITTRPFSLVQRDLDIVKEALRTSQRYPL